MKLLLLSALLCASSVAQDDQGKNIDELKAMITGNIDQHISQLQNFKSCISSASGREQLQECRKSHREQMEKFKEENKGERESFKEKMKAQREEKKANRKNKK